MKKYLAIIIVGICCLVLEGPIVGKLGVMAIMFLGSSFRSRKDGGVDMRSKINWPFALLGLAFLIAAFILSKIQGN